MAYTLTALIGHMAPRRQSTDDGISAAEAADFVVSLVIKGLRPSEGRPDHGPITTGQHP